MSLQITHNGKESLVHLNPENKEKLRAITESISQSFRAANEIFGDNMLTQAVLVYAVNQALQSDLASRVTQKFSENNTESTFTKITIAPSKQVKTKKWDTTPDNLVDDEEDLSSGTLSAHGETMAPE